MDLNEAKRLDELERENTELKKMLAEAPPGKRVLEYVVEKIMSPGQKKQMIRAVVEDGLCSGRKGCRITRLTRSTWWYRAGERSEAQQMVKRLHELSDQHPR
jgi:hypothetical protein